MELSPEDTFRLNVLLANKPLAIRIDESAMAVYGLSERGEARVPLKPTCGEEKYLKLVRELLSGHVTGSPGGYPVFLKRWTRMGQMRDESLAQLLLLGEPEAVVAAVCSPGITDELARRAWWAMQDPENARRMLASPAVLQGQMGAVLADYLVEYLPFETEPEKMIESVRLVLQPGLLEPSQRLELWRRSARRQAYQVGFLIALPDQLPDPAPDHPLLEQARTALGGLAAEGNACAAALLRLLAAPGQTFLRTALGVLKKPPNQDVVTATLDALRGYLAAVRPEGDPDMTLADLVSEAEAYFADAAGEAGRASAAAAPDLLPQLRAVRVLSGLGYGVVRPVLRDTTAVGSLMRRKLEPVMGPLAGILGALWQGR